MIIFQRTAAFDGSPDEISGLAVELTEAVNERTQLNASLWQGLFGRPVGTLTWSCLVESLTALEVGNDTLIQDRAFQDLVSRARALSVAPAEDVLLRMVHSANGDYVRPDVGAYAEVTMALPAEGELEAATKFGVEIADYHSNLTHSSTLFCTSAYGKFGQMVWLAMYPNAGEVDRAAEIIAKDEEYMHRLDGAEKLFVPGSGERGLGRRIL